VSSTQPQVNSGAVLAGRWQIQDFIGSSDTGEVYGARDTHGTATFALKLLWPNALAQAEIWSAVQQTARTAAGLGAEGVARAYDFGIDANSARPFFVSERVSWSSLADRVRLRGPLTPAELSVALGVVARALDAAHAAGVVHRDLKPENVFISPDNPNWVRVTDFGVSLLRSASPPPPGWGGTIGWVAPDAADPHARSTAAMDVFALGLVAFFALSGGALHRAARSATIDAATLWQELTQALDSASLRARELGASLDPAFDAWFQRAVAPMPQARFSSIAEMVSEFDAIVRTLVAPQSQNAVALPGIAAAVAQPLVFQPEPQPPASAPAQPLEAAAAPVYTEPADDAPSSALPGMRKRTAASLLIGGALLCVALTVLGIGALYHHRSAASEAASATALASASASQLAASAGAAVASTTNATAGSAAAPSDPEAAPAVVAVAAQPPPSATTQNPLVSKHTDTAMAPSVAAAKPVSDAPKKGAALPAAKVAVTAVKPSGAPLKATVKPALLTPPKKKCGSTFIPCK
jgi:serine/threonine-protein kinase